MGGEGYGYEFVDMGYLKIDENIVESYKSIKPNSLY
jgi:hypothetical protein